MDNNIRKKNIILSVVIVLVGIFLAGGTYAYLTFAINVTNNVVNANTTCFDIDYLDTNQITGTLFPSAGPAKGIKGKVTMKVKSSCDLDGVGKLYIHVNSGTSTKFGTVAPEHCEDMTTLSTLATNADGKCKTTNSGNDKMTGSVFKFAVYDNADATGTPLSAGYFDNSVIGSDWLIYSGFEITHTQKDYYIFLWLDGALTDNTYTNLSFNGYIKATATQKPYREGTKNNSLPSEYQQVEYIESHGTECIYGLTKLTGTGRDGIYLKYTSNDSDVKAAYGYILEGTSNYFYLSFGHNIISYTYNGSNNQYYNYFSRNIVSNTINTLEINYLSSNKFMYNDVMLEYNSNLSDLGFQIDYSTVLIGEYNLFDLYYKGSSSIKLYEFKRSKGNTIMSNFIPCYRKSDNVPGIYDVIGGAFYDNKCSGTFGIGKEIY